MKIKRTTRKAMIYGVCVIGALGMALVIFVPDARVTVLRTLLPGVCISEELKTIPNLSGMKFEIIYTNCDTLAKTEDVTVYVSRALVGGESFLTRWSNRKTAVFVYDPGGRADTPSPSIEISGNNRILISIPDVSFVFVQKPMWQNVHIDYKIGHNYNP